MKKLQNAGLVLILLLFAKSSFAQVLIYNKEGGAVQANSSILNLNVGIGTANPTAALHIRTGINPGMLPPLIKLERNDVSNQSNVLTVGIANTGFLGLGNGSAYFKLENPNQNSDMAFSTIPSAAQLIIKHNGKVGIGTASPTSRLHVAGDGYFATNVLIGISTPSNTQHKLQVHNGNIMVSGANGFGGPMILFSDNINPDAYPNGRWGIEYEPTAQGLNFWKPWNPLHGGGNYYLFLKNDGKVSIGIDPMQNNSLPNGYKLFVKEGIITEKVKVAVYGTANWADHVFADDHKLLPLDEVESFIKQHGHLPGVPSADELVKDGLDLGRMQAKHMEKIEELMLYMIEIKKETELLKKENTRLLSIISSVKNKP